MLINLVSINSNLVSGSESNHNITFEYIYMLYNCSVLLCHWLRLAVVF